MNYKIEIPADKIVSAFDAIGATPIKHKSAPKGYPEDKSQYADPDNYKYPIDSEAHVRSAWSYINKEHNQKGYSAEQLSAIKSRIKKAGKKYEIDFEDSSK